MIFRLASRGRLSRAAAALTLAISAGAVGYAAGATAPPETRVAFQHALPNSPGKTVTGVVVDYPPGGKSAPHHHAGVVFVYVISGAVLSQVNDEPTKVYQAGESFFEDLNSHHRISENASETTPARLLAVFVADDGATLTKFDE
jgi:quercetin dioxygenase-like cupin family protein